MAIIWIGLAVIAGIVWAWIAISQKIRGDRHQRKARASASKGDWEQAVLSYKLAILTRLDAESKLRELVNELSDVYRSRGLKSDLGQLLECPRILKTLGAGTRNQRKKNELVARLYSETGLFLNSLPGPPIPDK
jgi:hypothetical protein